MVSDVLKVIEFNGREYSIWVRSLAAQKHAQMFKEEVLSHCSGTLAFVGVALLCLGIFGVTDYRLKLKERETAIHLALGASWQYVLLRIAGRIWLRYAAAAAVGLTTAFIVFHLASSVINVVGSHSDVQVLARDAMVCLISISIGMIVPSMRLVRLKMSELLRER